MQKNPNGKRILLIMYGKSVGGAELQFIELANFLAKKYSIRLVSLGGDGALRSTQIDPSIEIQVLNYRGIFPAIAKLSMALFTNLRYPAERIVTTSFIANFLGWMLGVFSKRRLVSMQTVSKCMRHPFMDRFVLKRFDALIAGADDIRQYLIDHKQNPNVIHVIHNWVDFSKRNPSESVAETRNKLGIRHQTIIGCIGRLHPQKGQVYLIRAFAKILKEYPNTVLLLVGEGETRSELDSEVSRLALSEHVIFTGTASGNEYNNYLAAMDIYVQPSVFEGLPRTLLDAMYMGKAIVATDINGNKEAIQDGVSGLLVQSKSDEMLEDAILRLLRHESSLVELAQQARKSVLTSFSMDKQLTEIEAVINNQ